MENTDKVVLIVDALNLFTRHYVAHPALNSNGGHVGGIVGFLYSVISLVERYKPSEVAIIWEGGGSTRRRAIYSEYKSKRRPQKLNRYYEKDIPDTVENRNYQIATLVHLLGFLPAMQVYVPDCEADDVIGYMSKYAFKDKRKVIVSSDRDFYQLLDNKTIIYSPTWKKLVTFKEVKEKFGISPENFCLAKAICGDPSDNISGVKGVGFKTLSKRFPELRESTSVEISDIIDVCNMNISEGTKIKAYQEIVSSEDLIRRNWKLIYLDTVNLSASQIQKINYLIDTFAVSRNKIHMMRALIKEGIQSFNIDRAFLSFNHIR